MDIDVDRKSNHFVVMYYKSRKYRTDAEKYYIQLLIGLMIPTFRINFPASPIFEFDNHPLSDLKSYEVRKIEKTRKPQIFALILMTILLGKQNNLFLCGM